MNHFVSSWTGSAKLLSESKTLILKWHWTPCCSPCDPASSQRAYAKNIPTAWTSCTNEPKAIFKCKKCRGSETKFNRPDKNVIKENEALGSTHTSRSGGTSRTNVNLLKVWALHTLDRKLNHHSRRSLQHRGTHTTTPVPPPRPELDRTNHCR